MSSHLLLITVGFVAVFVLPVLGITWYSVRSDAHSPPPLQEGGSERSADS